MSVDIEEIKVNINGQWYYRGNVSQKWWAMASRADGSMCGIADSVGATDSKTLDKIADLVSKLP